jgi:hypothetical protein
MNLLARLTALESPRMPGEPWAVQVIVDGCCGTSAGVAYTDRTESMTLREYRDRFGERYRAIERWVILGDAEPVDDRLCEHW